ncbi:hypothetical protein GEMRC1_008885 [Eukaryota sp. GEM-RC1]
MSVSINAYGVLFCELVRTVQSSVSRADDLMDRLEAIGFPIGSKLIESVVHKHLKDKRPLLHSQALQAVLKAWKVYFGHSIVLMHSMIKGERKPFEFVIKDPLPLVSTYYSTPPELRDSSGSDLLRVTSFMGGIIKGMLTTLGFPCTIRTGHKPTTEHPQQTLYQVTFENSVKDREESL